MEKRFRDLKKGDPVWIIKGGDIVEEKVVNTIQNILVGTFYVYTYNPGSLYCGYPGSKRSGNMFVNKEDALTVFSKWITIRKSKLEVKINNLVSEFDRLDSISPPTIIKHLTKIPSIKELKPGDSVWYVDKGDMTVKEVKVKKIERNDKAYGVTIKWCPLNVCTSLSVFNAYPNSKQSTDLSHYTDEEQAWKYMLDWKKSRLKTVGNEMEKLIKELERYEKIW